MINDISITQESQYAPLFNCTVPSGCRQLAYNEVIQAGDRVSVGRTIHTGEDPFHMSFKNVPAHASGQTVRDFFDEYDVVVRIIDSEAYLSGILNLQKITADRLFEEQIEKLSRSFARQFTDLTTENTKLKLELDQLTKKFEAHKKLASFTPDDLSKKVELLAEAKIKAKLLAVEEMHKKDLESAKSQATKEEYKRIMSLSDVDMVKLLLEKYRYTEYYGGAVKYDLNGIIKLLVDKLM